MKKISIIVPCYNEEDAISIFYPTVENILENLEEKWMGIEQIEHEYWFINDGSSDSTLEQLKILNIKHPKNVHFVSFSRNFGKEAALYAGLTHSTGDYITVMDVDLQDPPELLPQMLSGIIDEGYDIVGTMRVNRKGEPILRSFFSNMFYKFINKISQTNIVNGARDYRLMTRQVVDTILSMNEYNRFSKGIFSWVGFKTKYIPFQNKDRSAGKTHWSFWQLFNYSLEGIIDFSEAPLAFASFTGLLSCILAVIAMIFVVIRALLFGDPTTGWPSIISIILFLGGLQLFCIGIVGKYIGKIYLESKHRPIYIEKEEK